MSNVPSTGVSLAPWIWDANVNFYVNAVIICPQQLRPNSRVLETLNLMVLKCHSLRIKVMLMIEDSVSTECAKH